MSDPAIYGRDLFGEVVRPKPSGVVARRFIVPPFSVLDARSGTWQERKRAWRTTGLRGEVGRSAPVHSNEWAKAKGLSGCGSTMATDYTSIFDPVLCELVYRWFCPPAGQVIDPFAGGSVRGLVASALGLRYWGCDLRAEQIDANRAQARDLAADPLPLWVVGDSSREIVNSPGADLLFTCPPYGDLERYSDDPADLSAMTWGAFLDAYRAIIASSVSRLRDHRFACIVVSDIRDRQGNYRNLVGETVAAYEATGCRLYNEAVILDALGSAAMRVTRYFQTSRKLVRVHQKLLVFVKGDNRRAADACKGLR